MVGFGLRLPGTTLGLSPVDLPSFSALISSELWTRWAGQPEAVCGATTQNCWASAGSARPKCSSTGGVPVAPSEMMSHRRLPDSPAPCRYSSKGSGSSACGGVYTSAAKVFGSRISVRGELVEEAKRRGADSEAASAISVRGELVCGRCPFRQSALLAERGDNGRQASRICDQVISKYSASRGTETSAYMYNNHPLTATKAQQSKNVPSFPSCKTARHSQSCEIKR